MAVSVYDRMVRLAYGQGTTGENAGVSDYIPFIAAINLTTRQEMVEFLNTYKQMFPDHWLHNIVYALEHTNMEIRTIWKAQAGDIVPIDPLMQRSEFELYIDKDWVNEKGEPVDIAGNTERAHHQSYGEALDVGEDNDPFVKIKDRLLETVSERYETHGVKK